MRGMFSLCATFFLLQAGMSLSNMYLPMMLKNQAFPYGLIGLTLALHELAGMAGPVVTGRFVDRTGKLKAVTVFCSIAVLVGIFVVAKGVSVPLTMLSFLLVGFFLKSVCTLQDTKALVAAGGNSQGYTYYRSFETLGCVFFSLFYSFLHRPVASDNNSIFTYYAIGSAVYLGFLLFGTKDTPLENETKEEAKKKGVWFDKYFIVGIVFVSLSRFALSSTSFLSLYMVDALDNDEVLLMQAIATAAEYVAMLVIGKLLQRGKLSSTTTLILSSVGVALRLVAYIAIPTLTGVVIGQCLHSLSYGFFQPAAIQFVMEHVQKSRRGEGIALMQAVGSGLPSMLGNSIGGFVIARWGYQGLFGAYSIPALLAAFLFVLLDRRMKKES
jgi:PPP family 3-phenylpropionic acid transporter